MYSISSREQFFKRVQKVDYVGMFLRLVPNPAGDLLLVLQNSTQTLFGYPPREVLTESELKRVYMVDTNSNNARLRGTTITGLANLAAMLKKPIRILEDQIGSKTSFCLLDVKIPYKRNFSEEELENIGKELYEQNPKLGLLSIREQILENKV